MKTKLIGYMAVVVMVAAIALSQTAEVSSVNAVGYVKVTCPGGQLSMLAVPLNPLSTNATFTLDELLGTNGLVASWDPLSADVVYIWTGASYISAFLNDDGWGDPAIDWKWCAPGNPPTVFTNTIEPGKGFWYRSRGTNFLWTAEKPYLWP